VGVGYAYGFPTFGFTQEHGAIAPAMALPLVVLAEGFTQ